MTANQVQIRRDSATNLNATTPASGELGYDTTNKRLRLGDGSTLGGITTPNSIDLQNQSFVYAAASGTDTITMTVTPAPTAYVAGARYVFKAAADNTGTATLNVNSLGAKTIKKRTTSGIADVSAGDIQQDGVYGVVYDGTYMQLEEATAASASSTYELLATATASASATLDFASVMSSAYSAYLFVLCDIRPATNDVDLQMRTSTNNGSSYDSAATDYEWVQNNFTITATPASAYEGSAGDTKIRMTDDTNRIGNATNQAVSGFVKLANSGGAVASKHIEWSLRYRNNTSIPYVSTGWGHRDAITDIDAVRFLMSSGNITSGTIYLYGIKNT